MPKTNISRLYHETKRELFDRYYSFLNPKQREAVYCVNGPLLILAGAGSGKTTVLVNRLAYLIRYGNAYNSDKTPADLTEDDVQEMKEALKLDHEALGEYLTRFSVAAPPAWKVMAVTFTNKAAREIKTRISDIFGKDSREAAEIKAGTFHSICLQFLRIYGSRIGYSGDFTVCDADDSKRQITLCMKELGIDDKSLSPRTVQTFISRAKDRLMDAAAYKKEVGDDAKYSQISQIFTLYEEKLASQNLLDFDDIIMQTVNLLKTSEEVRETLNTKYQYLSVDEFQDTNIAQLELTRLLTGKKHNVMVVGDDDQSIYKFRGAVSKNIFDFSKMFEGTKIIRLEENYRSTQNILNAANSVIRNNESRMGKELWTEGEKGDPILVKEVQNQSAEAKYITESIIEHVRNGGRYKDCAILYRMNAQSRPIEQSFARYGIPYRMLGGMRFFERAEIKDLIAYLAVINNRRDDLRLRRIINTPRRGIGDKSLQIAEGISAEEGISLLEFMRYAKRYPAIATATANQMVNFVYMMDSLVEDSQVMSLSELLTSVLRKTHYGDMINEIPDNYERNEKKQNIEELVSTVVQFENTSEEPTLSRFLEEVVLITDVDKYDETADAVVMMTVHSSKGLEFRDVYLPGMEENVFPSYMMSSDQDDVEEERRLAYVAITRAKKNLCILYTKDRMINGKTESNPVSRFVREIPAEYIDLQEIKIHEKEKRPIRQNLEKQAPRNFFREEMRRTPPALKFMKVAEQPKRHGTFAVGDRVRHSKFGVGTVIAVRPLGNDNLFEVAFEEVGTKKLMGNYAKLESAE